MGRNSTLAENAAVEFARYSGTRPDQISLMAGSYGSLASPLIMLVPLWIHRHARGRDDDANGAEQPVSVTPRPSGGASGRRL